MGYCTIPPYGASVVACYYSNCLFDICRQNMTIIVRVIYDIFASQGNYDPLVPYVRKEESGLIIFGL